MALTIEGNVTVWNVYQKDYVLEVGQASTGTEYGELAFTSSSKKRGTETYTVDVRQRAKFYGEALSKVRAMGLQEKDRIHIKGTLKTHGEDGKPLKYLQIAVWEVEKLDSPNHSAKPKHEMPKPVEVLEDLEPLDMDTDSLPF